MEWQESADKTPEANSNTRTEPVPTMLFPAIIWNSIGVHRARQPLGAEEAFRKAECPVFWFRSNGRASLTHSDTEDFGCLFHIPRIDPKNGAEASLAGSEAGHRNHVDLG